MISSSSVPNRPPSPAWGFSAMTAMRGSTMPKSSISVRRIVCRSRTIFSREMLRLISETGMCLVTSPTRRMSLHRTISGSPSSSAPRNSVWPVWRKSSLCTVSLSKGAVTRASMRPSFSSCVARRSASTAARPASGVA